MGFELGVDPVEEPVGHGLGLGKPVRARCSVRVDETALAGRQVFVYAGNMGVAQGMDILLDLAERLSNRADVGFLFVGRGSDAERLKKAAKARGWKGLVGLDLAKDVTCAQSYRWDEMRWAWPEGYSTRTAAGLRVVAIDYGAKRNILRCLASAGCEVTVLPATATAEDILAHNPEGIFLSNGPGDPAATGAYAVPMIQDILATDLPLFGICLGHQMLALALGAKTVKMGHGHHGANHPVKDQDTGKVEITSMNHGFTVDAETLPKGVIETHISLFDGTNCGIRVEGKPVFSVQHHPEASPGPQDSFYLFERFAEAMRARRAA